MNQVLTLRGTLLAAPLLVAGCAPAYHDYPQGCPRYAYCPPPPLPYVYYSQPVLPLPDCPQPLWCETRKADAEPWPTETPERPPREPLPSGS